MKFTTSMKMAALAAIAIATVGVNAQRVAHADGGYTVAALNGNYSFDESGTIGENRLLSIGVLHLDGKGGATGTATIRNGSADSATATVSGTYTINPDGTGVLGLNYSSVGAPVVNPDDGTTTPQTNVLAATYNLVLTSTGHVRAVRTDGGEFVSATLDKQVMQ